MIKRRRICLIFVVILLSACATSTINTDPYALRAMVDVAENSINDQEIYQDDMQFCSFEAAYNDVSNKGNLAAGSLGAAAGAAAATPAYLLAAPIAILAGGAAYFLGKGAEKSAEDNRRVQMMVDCLENKGYMVALTGNYVSMEEENSNSEKIPWGMNEEQFRNQNSSNEMNKEHTPSPNQSKQSLGEVIPKLTKNSPQIKSDREIEVNETINDEEEKNKLEYNSSYTDPKIDELNKEQTPSPKYPNESLRAGHEGVAKFNFNVSELGTPINIELVQSSGYKKLDFSALEALKITQFIPAKQDDKAIISKKVTRSYKFTTNSVPAAKRK